MKAPQSSFSCWLSNNHPLVSKQLYTWIRQGYRVKIISGKGKKIFSTSSTKYAPIKTIII